MKEKKDETDVLSEETIRKLIEYLRLNGVEDFDPKFTKLQDYLRLNTNPSVKTEEAS